MGFETVWALALGVSLSACSGFRAIVPLFVLALGHRLIPSFVSLGDTFSWMSSTPALIALSVAVLAETIADKIPAIDNIFDVIQTPLRTASGAVVVVAPFVTDLPGWALAILVLLGGASAFTVHGAKTTVRAASTATTAGTANPLISFAEDIFTWLMCLFALILAPFIAVLSIILIIYLVRKVRRFLKSKPADEDANHKDDANHKGDANHKDDVKAL